MRKKNLSNPIFVRFQEDLKHDMEKLAREQNRTMSSMIRYACMIYVKWEKNRKK